MRSAQVDVRRRHVPVRRGKITRHLRGHLHVDLLCVVLFGATGEVDLDEEILVTWACAPKGKKKELAPDPQAERLRAVGEPIAVGVPRVGELIASDAEHYVRRRR